MDRNIFAILLWLWLLGIPGAVGAAQEPDKTLLPPVESPLPMTSSFGEYRRGHYHGGVDFSTAAVEGVKVIAPRDGWVFRLRASGVGYGKAIYFRLDDGRTVLYAHLSRFHPRLERILENAQDREGRYEIDLRPRPGEIPFAAGEALGYSGQTGAGVAHLHAEIRVGEEASVAVNPLSQGWSVPDRKAPRVSRLRVAPAFAGVLVNGGTEPVTVNLDTPGDPAFRTTGGVRVWVETEDRTESHNYRLAPFRVRASVDSRERAEVVLERFDWNWAREVEWTFDSARARRDDERWVFLAAPPRGRQDIATEFEGGLAAIGVLEPGPHTLLVEASDRKGNLTRASVSFVLDPDAHPEELLRPRIAESRLVSRGSYLEIHVAGDAAGPPELLAEGPDGERASRDWIRYRAPGGWVYLWEADAEEGLWSFFRTEDPGERPLGSAVFLGGKGAASSGKSRVEGEGFRLELEPGLTYGPQWITLEKKPEPAPPADDPELEPAGPAIELGPWAAPLRERMEAAGIPDGPSRKGLALCSRSGDGWSYVGSDTTGPGVGGTLGSLETLALFRDRVPPRIEFDPLPRNRVTRVSCRIRDGGVGLHWSDLEMTLDGKPVVADWDPESHALTGHLRSPLESGEHQLVVQAADRVGNTSRRETTFTVP